MSNFSNPLTDYSPQMEVFGPAFQTTHHASSSSGAFSEEEELDLASEFLNVRSEQELDQFIGSLISTAGQALLGEVADPALEQDIGDILKSVAKVALPIVGGALGTFVGGPAGTVLGSSLASAAGHAFGLELEGLSPEDAEFEACKQFIRFAEALVRHALQSDPSEDPQAIAHDAAVKAARMHAPGFINISEYHTHRHRRPRRSGNWVRHHGKIVLLGL